MSNLLVEIGCEEIPARFMPGLLADLKKKTEDRLAGARLSFEAVTTLGTPRRLALQVSGLIDKQADLVNEVKGPPAEIAFAADGQPTPAALGFAKTQNVPVNKLSLRLVGQRKYVFAQVTKKGLATKQVLQSLLPEIINSLYQPVSMRWGNLEDKFIRPLHSLVAIYGTKIVPFTLAGIKSSNKTFGHRYSSYQKFKVLSSDLNNYKKILKKNGVIVDPEERKASIRRQVMLAARQAKAQPLIPDDLLAEVTFLTENPLVYLGSFNPEFLAIPQEVLITSMKKNQKYFPLTGQHGLLLPKFAVVTDNCKNRQVVAGNEKVLSARLADARFFFEEDKKVPLRDHLGELANVAFFEKLGNLQQKSERTAKLAEWLGKRLGLKDDSLKICRRIAELSKADLVTKMVFEFPELQGTMGKYYAALSGEDKKVAQGIYEHYLPRFADDELPASPEGAVVALADRLDLVVGALAAGATPTGSEDPYGLRRAVQGLIKIIFAKKFDLLLDETLEYTYKLYGQVFAGQNFPKLKKEILDFILGRLRPQLLESGIRYDVADAALGSFNDVLDVFEKAAALNSLLQQPWLAGVVASADRLGRITIHATREQVLEHDLVEPQEKELYALGLKTTVEVSELVNKENWVDAAHTLARLTDPIELFFDKILVMHQDERIKANRLALLKTLEKLYLSVADFRKIVLS